MTQGLLFASLAADNASGFYRSLVAYLARDMECPIRLIEDVPWQDRERRLYSGAAHLGVVCGLQYVNSRRHSDQPGVELLAAPVMRGVRYQLAAVNASGGIPIGPREAAREVHRRDSLVVVKWAQRRVCTGSVE